MFKSCVLYETLDNPGPSTIQFQSALGLEDSEEVFKKLMFSPTDIHESKLNETSHWAIKLIFVKKKIKKNIYLLSTLKFILIEFHFL